ncbi:Putative RNA polymerase II subunit A domain phosphatase [Rhizopus microsporus]|nr:Putative RNA polymerase II subunit A domain phosphatase [Rhizopus microsporus]
MTGLTQKKLQRIFPCDTSMVVVLDDRSDVWSYSPNLVRIKPYEYFVGTGDINNPARNKEEKKQEVTPDATVDTSEKAEAVESEETIEKADNDDANTTTSPTAATTDTPAITTTEDKLNESRNGDTNKNIKERKEEDPSIYDDEDVELYTMLNILKEIHRQFYKNPDKADVTKIIPSMKRPYTFMDMANGYFLWCNMFN